VLQQGEILPIGGRTVRRLDVRFVAATNADLSERVQQRRFREDLYYRLNVVPIVLPPLRDRLEDVAMLVRHFLDLYARRENREPLKVAPEVWRWLNTHSWPGNVREVENLCQRAVALAEGDTFDTDVLALTGSLPSTLLDSARTAMLPGESALAPRGTLRDANDKTARQLLERALTEHYGNVTRAADALEISRTTFYAKARKLRVLLPRERVSPR
jgi:transcriptional regulator with PAS, ATPase and Fis domain